MVGIVFAFPITAPLERCSVPMTPDDIFPEFTALLPIFPLTTCPDVKVTVPITPEAKWFAPICPEAMFPELTAFAPINPEVTLPEATTVPAGPCCPVNSIVVNTGPSVSPKL